MCGRFAITLPPDAVRAFFQYVEQPNFPPRTNIAPTQPVPIVRLETQPDGATARHFVLVRWGFLPSFVKDPKDFPLVINARAESVATKPSFRNAIKRRRCIFIADAFYEWMRDRDNRGKNRKPSVPFLIRRRDGNPMALAGIWETWTGPNGEEQDTACILTTDANALVAPIHDRMPVILEPEDFDTWLDCSDEKSTAASDLLKPAGEDVLEAFEISTRVNRVANDDAAVQTPVEGSIYFPDQAEGDKSAATGAGKRQADGGRRAKSGPKQQSLFDRS